MTLLVEVPEKTLNTESQFSPDPPISPKLNKSDVKCRRPLKQYLKDTWTFRSKITVEPFVVCYVLPSVLAGLAVQNLCFEKSCLVNLKYDNVTCEHIMQGKTDNYSAQEKNVQAVVSTMTGWSHPLQTALAGILALFIGGWSDRTGNRKHFMMIPILGKLISTLGLILSVVYFLQVGVSETALIEGLPPALTGGRVAMTMAVYSYVTDITSESERTFRLGIITATLTLSRPIGLAISGYMIKLFGYYGIFSMACVFYLIGFVYITLRLKKKTKKTVESQKSENCLSMFQINDLVATVKVAFKKRKYSRRLQILLVILAYMLILGPVLGEAQMTYWFTRYKFKFTEVDYSLFLAYSFVIGTVGSFITVYLFSKRWKLDDSIIGVIACFSRLAASVVYAVAPTSTIYFLGPILDIFSSGGATSLRSIATKLVHSDEIGRTSSLISISEALVSVIYSPLYSKVYKVTLDTIPGAFYFISAALTVPAIMILLSLHILRKNEPKHKKNSIEEKVTPSTPNNELASFL